MSEVYKVLANTIPIGTSNNTLNSARMLRIINADTVPALITVYDTVANTQLGTLIMVKDEVITLSKKKTDAITSNNATLTFASRVAI